VPLYSSVEDEFPGLGFPPNINPAFCVPAPPKPYLAVANAPPADQDVPLYSSVQARYAFPYPPATSP
jgi:hypothetical protein